MEENARLEAALALLEQRVAALKADRDYWRHQHDVVLADWREDLLSLNGGALQSPSASAS